MYQAACLTSGTPLGNSQSWRTTLAMAHARIQVNVAKCKGTRQIADVLMHTFFLDVLCTRHGGSFRGGTCAGRALWTLPLHLQRKDAARGATEGSGLLAAAYLIEHALRDTDLTRLLVRTFCDMFYCSPIFRGLLLQDLCFGTRLLVWDVNQFAQITTSLGVNKLTHGPSVDFMGFLISDLELC